MLTAPNPSPLSLFKLKKMILSLTSMGKYELFRWRVSEAYFSLHVFLTFTCKLKTRAKVPYWEPQRVLNRKNLLNCPSGWLKHDKLPSWVEETHLKVPSWYVPILSFCPCPSKSLCTPLSSTKSKIKNLGAHFCILSPSPNVLFHMLGFNEVWTKIRGNLKEIILLILLRTHQLLCVTQSNKKRRNQRSFS